jgi:hypothetical protein
LNKLLLWGKQQLLKQHTPFKKRVEKATSYGISILLQSTLVGFFFLCLQKHLLAWKMLSPIDANFHHLHAKPSTIQIFKKPFNTLL